MLYIRPLEPSDLESAKKLIQSAFAPGGCQGVYDLIEKQTMIFLDGSEPIGLCSFKLPIMDLTTGDLLSTAIIDLIHLVPSARNFNFTDGLVRAMMNLMLKKGIGRVFIPASLSESCGLGVPVARLAKIGLENTTDETLEAAALEAFKAYNYSGAAKLYTADLEAFFNQPCRSEQNGRAYS